MKFINKIIKQLKLPSPVDLGWSKSNALALRSITPNTKEYTWEDYHFLIKEKYPIKYYIYHTIPFWYRVNIRIPISHKYYKLRDLFDRQHLLDLRQQTENCLDCDYYQGGFITYHDKIIYALFNLLTAFYDKHWEEMYDPSELEIQENASLLQFKNAKNEVKELAMWWRIERKNDYNIIFSNDKNICNDQKEKLMLSFEEKEEEMCIRLIKIMKYLNQW